MCGGILTKRVLIYRGGEVELRRNSEEVGDGQRGVLLSFCASMYGRDLMVQVKNLEGREVR